MRVEEKEQIQSKLDAREKLASLGFGELIELSKDPNKFDYFMEGLANSMSNTFVCYMYPYFSVVREMINQNKSRLNENEDLSQHVFKVLSYFEQYDKYDPGYKSEFYDQYVSVVVSSLRLDKLGLTLKDFYSQAADRFRRMTDGKIDEMRSDKYYAATVAYLSKHHPEYLRNCYMIPVIYDTIYHPNKNDFEDKKDYKAFKKVASTISSNLAKYERERAKVKSKESHGYKW